jgi:hypothetical protein
MKPEFKPGTFPDDLDVRDVNGSRNFELLAPFRYQMPDVDGVWVPRGAPWNGASIPRFWWRVFGSPYVGRHRKPSVIHDWLWTEAQKGRCTYQRANWMFWHGLRSRGVRPFKAWLMWLAVAFNARLQRRPGK